MEILVVLFFVLIGFGLGVWVTITFPKFAAFATETEHKVEDAIKKPPTTPPPTV